MRFVVSTVIRETAPGEVHGRLLLVDLDTGEFSTALLWDLPVPPEAGGGARGLRGVCVRPDGLWVVSWGVLMHLGPDLGLRGAYAHPLLADAHQLCAWGDRLVVVSTGFDALLSFDGRRWDWGLLVRGVAESPTIRSFHPDGPDAPRPGDTSHLNMVSASDGALWISGLRLPYLVRLADGRAEVAAMIPVGTHDARPWGAGVLFHDTARDRLAFGDPDALATIPVPRYDPFTLHNLETAPRSRQAFARGIAEIGPGLVLGGTSPASVHVYDLARREVRRTIRLSDDVREAVHGIAPWPFAPYVGLALSGSMLRG